MSKDRNLMTNGQALFYNCLQISSETAVCYHTDNWPQEATCKEEEEEGSWQAFIVSFQNTTHLNWKDVCYELFNVSQNVLKEVLSKYFTLKLMSLL